MITCHDCKNEVDEFDHLDRDCVAALRRELRDVADQLTCHIDVDMSCQQRHRISDNICHCVPCTYYIKWVKER